SGRAANSRRTPLSAHPGLPARQRRIRQQLLHELGQRTNHPGPPAGPPPEAQFPLNGFLQPRDHRRNPGPHQRRHHRALSLHEPRIFRPDQGADYRRQRGNWPAAHGLEAHPPLHGLHSVHFHPDPHSQPQNPPGSPFRHHRRSFSGQPRNRGLHQHPHREGLLPRILPNGAFPQNLSTHRAHRNEKRPGPRTDQSHHRTHFRARPRRRHPLHLLQPAHHPQHGRLSHGRGASLHTHQETRRHPDLFPAGRHRRRAPRPHLRRATLRPGKTAPRPPSTLQSRTRL